MSVKNFSHSVDNNYTNFAIFFSAHNSQDIIIIKRFFKKRKKSYTFILLGKKKKLQRITPKFLCGSVR